MVWECEATKIPPLTGLAARRWHRDAKRSRTIANRAQRLGVRWQSGSGDTAFGRTKRVENSIRVVRAKAAWRCASRRSPRHAGANFDNPSPRRWRRDAAAAEGGFFLIKFLAGANLRV